MPEDSTEPEGDKFQALPQLDVIELEGQRLDPGHYLTKEYDDIGEAAAELPAIIEWLNYHLQSVIEQRITAEDAIKRAEAEAWRSLHDHGYEQMGYAGSKTGYNISMAIRLEPAVNDAKARLAVSSGWESRLINLMRTFQAKLDITRSLEATRRLAGSN